MRDLEQTIRERAYHLWVADGHRDGNAEAQWLSAQREILASSLEQFARVTAPGAGTSTKPEKKSAAKGKSVAVSKKKRRAA